MSDVFLSMMSHLMWVVFPKMLVVLCRCYVGLPCTNIVARFSVMTSGVFVTFDVFVKLESERCSLGDRVTHYVLVVMYCLLNNVDWVPVSKGCAYARSNKSTF